MLHLNIFVPTLFQPSWLHFSELILLVLCEKKGYLLEFTRKIKLDSERFVEYFRVFHELSKSVCGVNAVIFSF